MHTYMLTYVHAYTRTYMHTYTDTYIHAYIHAYLRTCIHTHTTHTYIQTKWLKNGVQVYIIYFIIRVGSKTFAAVYY
jgi:hypothetical protein